MDFQVGDTVEIFKYKEYLNDKRGLIVEMKGDKACVWIPDVRRGVSAMIPLDKLRKVEKR